MRKWSKWILVAALVALPAAAYAVTKVARSHKSCPASPDCPCHHGEGEAPGST